MKIAELRSKKWIGLVSFSTGSLGTLQEVSYFEDDEFSGLERRGPNDGVDVTIVEFGLSSGFAVAFDEVGFGGWKA